jgi:hypothetical protein
VLDRLARARLDIGDEVQVTGTGARLQLLARDVVAVLGAQPAFLRDVAPITASADELSEIAAADAAILDELRGRYAALRDTATLVAAELAAAGASGEAAALRQALLRALRWGVTPLADEDELRPLCRFVVRGELPDDSTVVPALARRAEQALRDRLQAAPPPDTTEPLGRAIAELAAPEGRLAVLSRIGVEALTRLTRLDVAAPDTALAANWLTVVAAVRPRLARLESLQLEALPPGDFPGFDTWSNAVGDPWQTAALADLRRRRLEPDAPLSALPRFVTAYSTADTWAENGFVACGLIDSWSEAVPAGTQPTTAVFGFNAPAARPPQAILMAVPADLTRGPGAPLDVAKLIAIVDETRELAHARAVRAQGLGRHLAAVPTTMLPAAGSTAVSLDSSVSFPT